MIIYNSKLEGLYNGDIYKDKEGRLFHLYYVNPSNVQLTWSDGYNEEADIYDSITLTIKLKAFRELVSNNKFQLVARSLYEPWIREGDIIIPDENTDLLKANRKYYVSDVINISNSIMLNNAEVYCEFYEVPDLITNSPKALQKSLIEDMEGYNDNI